MVEEAYSDKQEFDYNPMKMNNVLQEERLTQSIHKQAIQDSQFHWTIWCKTLATSMVVTAMQMIASGGDYYNEDNTITSDHRRLMRRSEPAAAAEGSETANSATGSMTMYEIQFVYKTFLIFAGLILVINSGIKALNTKISGMHYIKHIVNTIHSRLKYRYLWKNYYCLESIKCDYFVVYVCITICKVRCYCSFMHTSWIITFPR
jgi:hypothetical protein